VDSSASGLPLYGNSTLPPGIRSRIVNNINGLAMHVLEAEALIEVLAFKAKIGA